MGDDGFVLFLRLMHNDKRDDRDPAFIDAARWIGEQFVRRYCKGCKFHYGQSVNRVSMHVHTDEDKRALFKKLAWEWQSAPAKGKEGVKSASQVVAKIEKTFSLALNWTTWWKKRSHLIIAADMSASKLEDFLKAAPSTNNNIEAFHATFGMSRRKSCP